MNDEFLRQECKSSLTEHGKLAKELSKNYVESIEARIKFLEKKHAEELLSTQDTKSLKRIFKEKISEVYHCQSLANDAHEELERLLSWSSDDADLREKVIYLEHSSIPCIQLTRGLMPELINESNEILKLLSKIQASLKSYLGDFLI